MTKEKHAIWRFLASVKLALFTLFVISAASIIGTVLKQKQPAGYYLDEYGPTMTRLFEMFSLTDMYSSWWFTTLVALFAVNLVVCSIERLPGAWRLATLDNLAANPDQLKKMALTHRLDTSLSAEAATERMQNHLVTSGWKYPAQRERDNATLLFAQQGRWSRLGVYVVHLSILIIIAGATIGTVFGYKAYVYLPEGRSTDSVFLQEDAEPVSLGFNLYGERYERSYYANGMIREYRADLTVTDPQEQGPYSKSIVINDPLNHRGITFYLGDSHPLEEYFVVIRHQTTGREQAFRVPAEQDVDWPAASVSFRIEELSLDQEGAVRQARLNFTDSVGASSEFWMKDRDTVAVPDLGGDYTVSFRQLYTNLLLVTKDPGVWIVWVGCLLMLIGLAMSFLYAHRRLWVLITSDQQGTSIYLCGNTNKQRPTFERCFGELVTRLDQDKALKVPARKKNQVKKKSG